MTGVWIVLAAAVLALAFGGYRRLTDGRAKAVAADAGPCLACVSAQRRVVEDGHDDTIAAWVAATVALQVRGLARIRKTEFVGISFLWSGRIASTDTAGWDRRDHCAVPGCRDYRDSSITASREEPYLDTFA